MKRLLLILFLFAGGFHAYNEDWINLNANPVKDEECDSPEKSQSRTCLKKSHGEQYYYVTSEIMEKEVNAYFRDPQRLRPGDHAIKTSNGETIMITVEKSDKFYCPIEKRTLYRNVSVSPHKPFMFVSE